MASSASASGITKTTVVPKKNFTFKKRVPDSGKICIDIDEDDDDDFKPCKFGQFPARKQNPKQSAEKRMTKKEIKSTGREAGTKLEKETGISEGEDKDGDKDETDVKTDADGESGELESLGVLVTSGFVDQLGGNNNGESDQENSNEEITYLCSSEPLPYDSGSGSQTAWKDLMSQMQKNQKDALQQSSRNKASSKRGMGVRSPATRKGVSSEVRSPLKKNPRLGSSKQGQEKCTKVPADADVLELAETHIFLRNDIVEESKSIATKDAEPTMAKIAPIFLPPAERKALSKTTSVGVALNASEVLKHVVDSQSIQHIPGKDNPNHFDGNVVLLNLDQPNKDPYEGNKTKTCPFYKKLPGVPFCVDAFNYGLIPGMEIYFLSHFHSDHYIGLNKKFCKTLICSSPTGNLVRMKLYVEEKCIRKLQLDKPYIICDSEVTLVDANHCPGSVMFIFRLKSGEVILHTGDFRYAQESMSVMSESGRSLLRYYIKKHLEYRPKTLIVCGSYMIGKERVYITLAEAIGSKVFGNYDKRKIINALEIPKFSSLMTADEKAAVHVIPMFSINAKNLKEQLDKQCEYSNIIGVKPTGWQFSSSGLGCSIKTHYGGAVTIIGIPYSEHSSFSELKEFVKNMKPRKVQPTVNVGNPKKRSDMMQHIEMWLKG